MTKQEIAKMITHNGKPISLTEFTYDPITRTISTHKDYLVFDFSGLNGFKFITGSNCNFITGFGYTFKTDSNCTFNTGSSCTFETGFNCVCIRRDIFEVIEIPEGKTIKLNSVGSKGYTIINDSLTIEITVKINGKESKLSDIPEETLLELRNL